MAENIDHQVVCLFSFENLFLYHPDKLFLTRIKFKHILNAMVDRYGFERSCYIIARSEFIRCPDTVGIIVCRNDDNRNLIKPVPVVHDLQHTEAVHIRHIDVKQHDADIHTEAQLFDRLDTVLHQYIVIIITQDPDKHFPVEFGVVGNQDSILFRRQCSIFRHDYPRLSKFMAKYARLYLYDIRHFLYIQYSTRLCFFQ